MCSDCPPKPQGAGVFSGTLYKLIVVLNQHADCLVKNGLVWGKGGAVKACSWKCR